MTYDETAGLINMAVPFMERDRCVTMSRIGVYNYILDIISNLST